MIGYEVMDGVSIEEQLHGRFSYFEKEVQLARSFVLKSAKPTDENTNCILCSTSHLGIFFEKWGLKYHLCPECWTIFAHALRSEAKLFSHASELAELRNSFEYQTAATESRSELWASFIQWIEHRVLRYLGKREKRVALTRNLRYSGMLKMLRQSPAFARVDLKGSGIAPNEITQDGYDAILYLDSIQQRVEPLRYLTQAHDLLNPDGILFITTRLGTGFDILTLKGKAETIFPYEHVFLPSVKGLSLLLEKAGFTVLEVSTPGMFDMALVYKQRSELPHEDLFARFLTLEYNDRLFMDFQKVLQKHGLSSTVRIIARKR